jgi:hypothetical protein
LIVVASKPRGVSLALEPLFQTVRCDGVGLQREDARKHSAMLSGERDLTSLLSPVEEPTALELPQLMLRGPV